MRHRTLLLCSVLVCTTLVLVGCVDEPEESPGGVSVENLRLVEERDGSQTVRGVVINGSSRSINVIVEVALYDEINQRVGEVSIGVEGVAPGGEQGFSHTLDDVVAGASVRSLMAF